MPDAELLHRIESCYDAIARFAATAEPYRSLTLFVAEPGGWPLYARPTGTGPVTAADLTEVRQRQRTLGLPEAYEWVHELHPELLGLAGADRLSVLRAPLLALDRGALTAPALPEGVRLRLLDPADPGYAGDVATSRAVAHVGFGAPGVATGDAGPAERDAARRDLDPDQVAYESGRARRGLKLQVVAETREHGPVATGGLLPGAAAAEVAGVATLPAVRCQGLGAAVTAELARQAYRIGVDLVYLSAGSDDIARVYQRIGFRRIGTACIAEPARP